MKLNVNIKGLDIEKIQNDPTELVPLLLNFNIELPPIGWVKLVRRGSELKGKIVEGELPLDSFKSQVRLAPSISKRHGEEDFTIKGLTIQPIPEKIVMPESFPKPSIGVIPRYIHDEKRREHLREAIERYMEAVKAIPVEWVEEYNDLANTQTGTKH